MRISLAILALALLCQFTTAQPDQGDVLPVPLDARPVLPVPPISSPALTLTTFSHNFRPIPGPAKYEVVLIHPCTCRPVKVCFALPGCPKRIRCKKSEIVFRYGLCKKPVVVTFCRDGCVKVH